MTSVFDFTSSFFFPAVSAVSDDSTSSEYSMPQTVSDLALCCQPSDLRLLLDQLHHQKQQHLQILKQLKEEINELEQVKHGLEKQEERLRTLLGRVAREGEEDLKAERRRRVMLEFITQ
eukprot:TRINITY_DN6984_c0_g2_i21.p1 TRINITY_DN6984_c0_g2~~TRINITY_DN6984_c0_g2_i21.p1  ORF type:complete len:119 (-),score=5.18 TRINITY_DN6984_c0_g2_i21:180-536(-)